MDDLISRQAAKEAVRMVVKDLPTRTEINILINDLPSAQPERKTGKWIEYEQKFMTDRYFETIKKHVRECSLCRTKIAGFDGTMRYCPNCGAKMDEVTT